MLIRQPSVNTKENYPSTLECDSAAACLIYASIPEQLSVSD